MIILLQSNLSFTITLIFGSKENSILDQIKRMKLLLMRDRLHKFAIGPPMAEWLFGIICLGTCFPANQVVKFVNDEQARFFYSISLLVRPRFTSNIKCPSKDFRTAVQRRQTKAHQAKSTRKHLSMVQTLELLDGRWKSLVSGSVLVFGGHFICPLSSSGRPLVETTTMTTYLHCTGNRKLLQRYIITYKEQ